MYQLGGQCGYCGIYCSRDDKKDPSIPELLTPNIPFIKSVVCRPCFEKIYDGMETLIENMLKDGTAESSDIDIEWQHP